MLIYVELCSVLAVALLIGLYVHFASEQDTESFALSVGLVFVGWLLLVGFPWFVWADTQNRKATQLNYNQSIITCQQKTGDLEWCLGNVK